MGSEHLPAGEPRTGDPPSLALRSPMSSPCGSLGRGQRRPLRGPGRPGPPSTTPTATCGAAGQRAPGPRSPLAAGGEPSPRGLPPCPAAPGGRRGGDGAGSRPLADSLPLTFSSTPALAGGWGCDGPLVPAQLWAICMEAADRTALGGRRVRPVTKHLP